MPTHRSARRASSAVTALLGLLGFGAVTACERTAPGPSPVVTTRSAPTAAADSGTANARAVNSQRQAAPQAPEAAQELRFDAAGIAITKPADWHVASKGAFADVLGDAKSDVLRAHLAKKLAAGTAFPLVGLIKWPEDRPGVNPTVQVRLLPRKAGMEALPFLEASLAPAMKLFTDPKVVEPPTARRLAGVAAARTRVQYTLTMQRRGSARLETVIVVLPRGAHFVQLTGIVLVDEKESVRRELTAVVDSLRLFEPVAAAQ